MTRKGSRQDAWTTGEKAYLRDAAGRLPRREICLHLRKSTWSVRKQAQREGISLRCHNQRLVWCSECASWRTYTDSRTGRCRVCTMREQLYGRENACAEALMAMDPEQRAVYEESEARRATRRLPPRPAKRPSCPMSMYERKKAEELYLRELEQWEHQCLKLQYDASKTRLRRMREKTGTNPRKKK